MQLSQSELSKIEKGQTKKIDFLLMDKICTCFEKDFNFFIDKDQQIKKIEKLEEGLNNVVATKFFPEKIIHDIKKLIEENKQKDELIKNLKKAIYLFRNK